MLFRRLTFEQGIITGSAESLRSDSTGQTQQIHECICEMREVKLSYIVHLVWSI